MKIGDAISLGIIAVVGIGIVKLLGGFGGIKDLIGDASTLFKGEGEDLGPTLGELGPYIPDIIEAGGTVGIEETGRTEGIDPSIMYWNPVGQLWEFFTQKPEKRRTKISKTRPKTITPRIKDLSEEQEEKVRKDIARTITRIKPEEKDPKKRYTYGGVSAYTQERLRAVAKYGTGPR
jgi:hypothetical protein